MAVIGIIAELNPLHKGHEYLIKKAKQKGAVICALSGNFVQRGDVALVEKGKRTEMALSCGADLVIELPILWSMSTAQNFALGGVTLLKNAGCDCIMFGSEEGETEELIKIAEILLSKEFSEKIKGKSALGITFARARQEVCEELGAKKDVLSRPNNNLAVEYIAAALKQGFDLSFETVKRIGADHDSLNEEEFASASLLRNRFLKGEREECFKYMPEYAYKDIKEEDLASLNELENAILSSLRLKTAQDLKKLPDITEGIENKLFASSRVATSLESLYNEVKVKRYTAARTRRLVLSAFLGLDNSFFMKPPPYIRVLGFNKKGEELLRGLSDKSKLPIVVKATDTAKLSYDAQRVFEAECRATDVFGLATKQKLPCGLEYTRKLIKRCD